MAPRIIFSSFLIVIIITSASLNAQTFKPYEWDKDLDQIASEKLDSAYNLYYIQKKVNYQYIYENDNLVCFLTTHNKIKVNNDEALSASNRVYIPMYNTLELMDFRGRVITSSGKTIKFDQSSIKELENEEEGYKIMAIEGAEVGSIIEYFYTRKMSPSNFTTQYIQDKYPVLKYLYQLECPENLEYDFKVYNSKSIVNQKDTSKLINQYALEIFNISPLFEEDFSAYKNNLIRLEIKLAYNSVKGNGRLFTWGEAGKRIGDLVVNKSQEEKKTVGKFINKLDLSINPYDALMQAEHMIKTSFYYAEEAGDDGIELESVLKNKFANSRGFTRLFAAILEHLDIEYEIVLTSNRYEKRFDPSFDTWNYLDEYLLYIPKYDQYLSPKSTEFRLGRIPDEFIGTDALFVASVKIQDFNYPVARTGQIDAPAYSQNLDRMLIRVKFNDAFESNNVHLSRSFQGYSADYYKTAMLFVSGDQKKEIIDEVFKFLALDAEIINTEIDSLNATPELWNDSFTVSGEFITSSYIENAGDIILFKVGELIGPQSELYQEEERTQDVVNQFNRGYIRKISIDIPKGYTIQNPSDLIIDKSVQKENKTIYLFNSEYSINNGKLEIEINEYYDELYFDKDQFESFRDVINAAADFNKIVLVISKST